jgi:signal transduction histidine kinase
VAIALTVAPENSASADASGAVIVFSDISHRRQIDELRDSIISMVSHELRTPIHHVRAYASSLLQDDVHFSEETRLEFIQGIDQEAKRLGNLVSNILEMSRLGSGKQSVLNLSPTCPHDLVRSSLDDASFRFQGHLLSVDVSETLLQITADPERVKLVLANLLDNAAKYSQPGSSIQVNARAGKGEVIFSVEDEGPGIPVEDRERIFERFTRLYREGVPHVPGTGLGLAICKMIVSSHNGRIWIDSGPGGGSIFSFTLPIAPQP